LVQGDRFAFTLAAGYMKKIRGSLLGERVVNTHPGILPLTRGQMLEGACKLVVASSVDTSAQTLHWVTEEYDAGEVIAENRFPVNPADTWEEVARKAQLVEKHCLPIDLTNLAYSL
jgi:phosphoribosylglycinamide formyltransferase 1